MNKILVVILSVKGIKLIIELTLNLLIIKNFGVVEFGYYATALSYTVILTSLVYIGSKEFNLKYFQKAPSPLNSYFEIFSFRLLSYFIFQTFFLLFINFFNNEIIYYYIFVSFNSFVVLIFTIEHYLVVLKKHLEFQKKLFFVTFIFGFSKIALLVFDILVFKQFVIVYLVGNIFQVLYLMYSTKNSFRFKFSKNLFKILVEYKKFIYFQVLVVVFHRIGIIIGSQILDSNMVGRIGLSFTGLYFLNQILGSFVESQDENIYSLENKSFSNFDRKIFKEIKVFILINTLIIFILYNFIFVLDFFKQFVYLRMSFSILILCLPNLMSIRLSRIYLIKSKQVRNDYLLLLFSLFLYIVLIYSLAINKFLYTVEFSFLISLTFFNFFNSNNQNIHLRDLSFTNIKNSYINVFKNY